MNIQLVTSIPVEADTCQIVR